MASENNQLSPVSVTLKKLADGFVQIMVQNNSSNFLAAERYGDRNGAVRLYLTDSDGQLQELKLDDGVDPVGPLDTDWVVLGSGDSIGWEIEYSMSKEIRKGSKVLVQIDKASTVPKSIGGFDKPFPDSQMKYSVVVQ